MTPDQGFMKPDAVAVSAAEAAEAPAPRPTAEPAPLGALRTATLPLDLFIEARFLMVKYACDDTAATPHPHTAKLMGWARALDAVIGPLDAAPAPAAEAPGGDEIERLVKVLKALAKAESNYDRMFGAIEFLNVNANVSEIDTVLKKGLRALAALRAERDRWEHIAGVQDEKAHRWLEERDGARAALSEARASRLKLFDSIVAAIPESVANPSAPLEFQVASMARRMGAAEASESRLRGALAQADAWVLHQAEIIGRNNHRADPFASHPVGLIWDHACAECLPGGPLLSAGFQCAVHAAKARAALLPEGTPKGVDRE